MSIPDKFIMLCEATKNEWLMEIQADGMYSCVVTKGVSVGVKHPPYRKSVVQEWLSSSIFKIKEDLTVREYPERFTMKSTTGGIDYEFVFNKATGLYDTEYKGQVYSYEAEYLDIWRWYGMVPYEANGVDAEGKPFHFTKDMLKPFMRVATESGCTYIVAPASNKYLSETAIGDFIGVRAGCWLQLYFNNRDKYSIKEVYEAPELNQSLMDPNSKGKLIWRYVEPAKQIQKSEMQKQLEAVGDQIKALQDEYAKLQVEAEKV
jgi:hypothetical protein